MGKNNKIQVMLADDHGLVREGLHILFDQQDDMEVVGEASDGLSIIDMVSRLQPDVILMDVSMPVLNGIEATRQITADYPEVKILALSAFSDKCFVTDMLKAGVSGYVLKDCLVDELTNAVRAIMKGERYLSTKIAGIVIEGYITNTSPDEDHSPLAKLSGKERQLLQLLAEGNSNKEAARTLHVSTKTVDARRRTIMDKLNVFNISDLTKFAVREGVTSLDF